MSTSKITELIDDIEGRVASGQLRPGDRLPSIQSQAEALGLAPNTVAAAYRRLRERGVVVGRGKQGTVIAERRHVSPMLSQRVPDGVVDAMKGNPDPSLLPDISRALAAAALKPPSLYGDALVDHKLATHGRSLFAADGVDATNLTVVSGAMDAVARLLVSTLRPGDRVGVEDPGYSDVHRVVTGMGFELIPIPCDDLGMVPDALSEVLEGGLGALIVTPRAGNPTGAAFDEDRAAALDAALSVAPDVLVIQDDHAGPIAGVDFAGLSCDRSRWAVVRSMAKSMGPDLRVALVVGDRDSIDRVEARLQIGPGWVSNLLQRTVAELLTDSETAAALETARSTYAARRTRMCDALRELGLPALGQSGFHVWLPVPDEQTVVIGLRDRGFAVNDGRRFRVKTPPAVRITVASLTDAQIDDLAVAMGDTLTADVRRSRTA